MAFYGGMYFWVILRAVSMGDDFLLKLSPHFMCIMITKSTNKHFLNNMFILQYEKGSRQTT